LVQEGEGWRLVVDPARSFPVLVGGSHWAAELAPEEARALRAGLLRLRDQHQALADVLMEEEAITLEFEVALEPQGGLWLELEGGLREYALRFVLSPAPGRRALEGAWSASASAAFMAAIAQVEGLHGAVLPGMPHGETGRILSADQDC